jgi:O-antigen/teichoic acid export membrane protein
MMQWASRVRAVLRQHPGLSGKVVQGSLGGLAVKSAYIALQFTVSVVLARALGVADFGTYSVAMAVATLVLIPSHLGFPAYLVRMSALYQSNGEVRRMRALWKCSFRIVTACSVLTVGAIALVIVLFGSTISAGSRDTLLIGLSVVPVLALLMTSGGALRGLGRIVAGQVPEQIGRPAVFLFLLVLLWKTVVLTPNLAMLANLVATILSLVIAQNLLWRHAPAVDTGHATEFSTGLWIRGAMPFMVLAGSQMINHQTDILMLGVMMSPEEVGRYRVAVQVADSLLIVMTAISASIAPHLASVHGRGDWVTIRRMLVTAHRSGIAVLGPVAVLLALFGKHLLELVYGPEYGAAAGAMAILGFGKALYATVGFCGVALSMFGYASTATVVTLFMTGLNVIMNLWLIPLYGVEGAALATSASVLIVNGVLAYWMWRRFGSNVTAIGRIPE